MMKNRVEKHYRVMFYNPPISPERNAQPGETVVFDGSLPIGPVCLHD